MTGGGKPQGERRVKGGQKYEQKIGKDEMLCLFCLVVSSPRLSGPLTASASVTWRMQLSDSKWPRNTLIGEPP